MASTMDRLWKDYEEHHHSAGNQYCHMVGIPLIIAGMLGLLSFPILRIRTLPVEPAFLVGVASGAAYLWLDAKLGGAIAIVTPLFYLGARRLPWPWGLALLLAEWALQFIGHGVYEKRSAAFFHNPAHSLIGPLWVLNHFVFLPREHK